VGSSTTDCLRLECAGAASLHGLGRRRFTWARVANVAYHLELHQATVIPYLDGLALSQRGKETLGNMLRSIEEYGELYRGEPVRRLFQGSECFRVDFVFRDPGHGTIHNVHLVISDAAAQYGVLRVVYAEDFVKDQPT
jgi:hypothetical protein